jgi:hypothetical protein
MTKTVGARTVCCVCGQQIVLYVGDKLWYHLDGTMYCCDQRRIESKLKAHDSENSTQPAATSEHLLLRYIRAIFREFSRIFLD